MTRKAPDTGYGGKATGVRPISSMVPRTVTEVVVQNLQLRGPRRFGAVRGNRGPLIEIGECGAPRRCRDRQVVELRQYRP